MKQLGIPEVEEKRQDVFLYRALVKLRDGLNATRATLAAGTMPLLAGTARIYCPGLTRESIVFAVHQRILGTPGHLSVDPLSYNLATHEFTVTSSSPTDTSVIAWLHWA